jgi:Zn-dependent metalloprotease
MNNLNQNLNQNLNHNLNQKLQILYQKTDFNQFKICQLANIFKCCKCKKNNTIITTNKNVNFQMCLFCGTPNNTKK